MFIIICHREQLHMSKDGFLDWYQLSVPMIALDGEAWRRGGRWKRCWF